MKIIPHIYDINRTRPRHRFKCIKYKMSYSTMMVICIKQHLSTISSSVREKVN